nr:histidine kinase-, DNA gyrase B-, and HSP90-like ATPase family protein [Tanacetum cinerariifolium]
MGKLGSHICSALHSINTQIDRRSLGSQPVTTQQVNGDKGSGQLHDIAVKGKYSINEEKAAKIIETIRREEFGFSDIKALCDVGNSKNKEPGAGYIGKKGIGFKSVFRVTDAPEIHSNRFLIKFDMSEGSENYQQAVEVNDHVTDTHYVEPGKAEEEVHSDATHETDFEAMPHWPSYVARKYNILCIPFLEL